VPYIDIIDEQHPTAKGLVQRSIDKAEAAVRARSATRKVGL
jgi:hypothetical protein